MIFSIKTLDNGPVNGSKEVIISCTKDEADELRKALAIVDKYKKVAYKALKHKEKNADWTMEKYKVKNDRVIVIVESGACG